MIENTDEKLATVKSSPDKESHLIPNVDDCRRCNTKNCLYVCPAGVYEWDNNEQKLIVKYENCLECGACRIACAKKSLIWKYPKSNFGITYKQG
ncbi:4Fe-4S dicluster domain-containing protein [bacterium]|nr:4Fe-4S dicluster domain-containing protein [bacterium]